MKHSVKQTEGFSKPMVLSLNYVSKFQVLIVSLIQLELMGLKTTKKRNKIFFILMTGSLVKRFFKQKE
jgi:hypothetical protein